MTKLDRIEKLMGLLTIAFCFAFAAGEWQADEKPILLKKHARPAISIFHCGLRYLKNLFINVSIKTEELVRIFKLLFLKFNPSLPVPYDMRTWTPHHTAAP